jgi:MoxR-like ATPase
MTTVFISHISEDKGRLKPYTDRLLIVGRAWWEAERQRSVVLIDEIDKAPRDFANDLLDELDKMQFQVSELQEAPTPEFGSRYELRPVVIITSNQERQLPDAFLRRCLYFHISFPQRRPQTDGLDAACQYFIEDIVAERLGTTFSNAEFLKDALDFFYALREPQLGLRKPPATAELLNWLVAMHKDGVDVGRGLKSQDGRGGAETGFIRRSIATLLKNPDDRRKGLEHLQTWLRTR